ncbi:MAG: polymorphic toxin type 50 domain-containing protein [Planctomycetia bacterium]|nr:polymorphic toxin type 50 domain-containing protein [Planctomycetia bacterium]
MSKGDSGLFSNTFGDRVEKTPNSSSPINDSQNEHQNNRPFSDFPLTIHDGKQGKHIPGHPNYQKGRSTLSIPLPELQKLVMQYSGTGEKVSNYKERVDFGKIIGQYMDPDSHVASDTKYGMIIYSKTGVHVVPARPQGGSDD